MTNKMNLTRRSLMDVTGKMRGRRHSIILLLLFCFVSLQGQQTDISVRVFPSSWYNKYFEPGFEGGGICAAYHPILSKVLRLNVSAEYSFLRTRNEVLLGFGINKTIWQAERFRVSMEANLLNGIDLYRPAPLYAGGIESVGRFDFYLTRKLTLFLGIGVRYLVCPGYRSYGVWRYSSWPVMLGVRF